MTKISPLSFHVRHEVRPERVLEILSCLSTQQDVSEIIQYERQIARAKMLNLVEGSELTSLGDAVLSTVSAHNDLWGELGHYLHYTLWDASQPTENTPAYLYRLFCDHLYSQTTFDLSTRQKLETVCVQLAGDLESVDVFAPFLGTGISLSPDSLRGILFWLEVLRPSVIEDNIFQRRNFCSPELLLLAIGFVMRDEPDVIDIDILLNHTRREAICRLCLLDPLAFDQTLDWMLPLFPQIVSGSEDVGYFGRSIRLRKLPTIEDVIR